MKVGFATSGGRTVDEHFGRAGTFAVWDVTPNGGRFVELRKVAEGELDTAVVVTRGMGALHDDAIAAKIAKLADCRVIYFTEIGGPSAAKLVRSGIMPLKAEPSSSIDAAVERLVETMRTNPAPWMRRALAEESTESAEDAAGTAGDLAPGDCGCGGCA